MKSAVLFLLLFVFLASSIAQEEPTGKSKIKTGWTFGAVPVVAYDSDVGFKYGALANFYNYGDGSRYPQYDHSIYMEWSRTTKGSGINQITFDSEKLIPGLRVLAEASYLTEKALDFYGFNGYNAYYNSAFEDTASGDYLSRVFYRMDRSLLRLRGDVTGKLSGDHLKWVAGFEYFGNRLDTVDLDNLNKGTDDNEKLPPSGGGLYGNYISQGIISEDQADGGNTGIFKIGAVYDSRDNEANPMSGLWTEMQFLVAPAFMGDDFGFTKLALTHRQYFPIHPVKLNFAYRLSYQAKLTGEMPFYMLPFVFNSAPQLTRDGLGGGKTMRGILRNRVVGEDFLYGNAELRWKIFKTVVFNQNFYVALAGFADAGMVTGKYDIPDSEYTYILMGEKEKLHASYGAGLHFALNDNFIITVDYGMAAKKEDGDSGLYINIGFLY